MKTMIALGLACIASAAPAQFVTTGPAGPQVVNIAPGSPLVADTVVFATDITPTTQRQRIERAQMVDGAFPTLRQELADRTPYAAQTLYARAEKEARWQKIRARD